MDVMTREMREQFTLLRQQWQGRQDILKAVDLTESILGRAGEVATLKTTYVGMPHIHNIENESIQGCLVGCSEQMHLVTYDKFSASLLAWGFNHLWCMALNARKYDRWLLHHADISHRTKHWLDKMTEDMDRGGWDAIHVPQAIKDARGLTSTGIGNADDEWARIRRLTTAELRKLPPVFGLDEALEVMKPTGHVPKNPVFCPNTGCLLIRMDRSNRQWLWDFPGFNIKDRLTTRVEENGLCVRVPEVLPEDWHFGFWMQSRGLKVGATKRVRSNHHSGTTHRNDDVWGEEKDEGYLTDPMHW